MRGYGKDPTREEETTAGKFWCNLPHPAVLGGVCHNRVREMRDERDVRLEAEVGGHFNWRFIKGSGQREAVGLSVDL